MYTDDILKITKYIEEHLLEDITLDDLSMLVFISPYHLHRIFTAMTGETLGGYIRKRRLTCAAKELVEGESKIIDIAVKYNFGSQEAFSRAFKNQFNKTPAKFRTDHKLPLSYIKAPIDSKTLFYLLNSNKMEEPKIVTKEAFKIVGMETDFSRSNNLIPWLWQQFNPRVGEIKGVVGNARYGICQNPSHTLATDSDDDTVYRELVGVEVKGTTKLPDGMVMKEFPAHKYAVFTHKGFVSDLPKSYNYIYGQWASTTEYRLVDFYDFELYGDKFIGDSADSEMEIWVPIED